MSKQNSSDFFGLLDNREFGIFIYYAAIIMIAMFIIRSFIDFPVVNYQGWIAMLAFLTLVIMLEPPKAAELQSEPFENNELIDS